jgi:apolipoprotein N-acyltransferase
MRHAAGILATAVLCALASRITAPWYALFWVGVAPWLAVLDRVTTWRGALASGLAMAAAFSAAVFPWFPIAVAEYASAPVWPVAAIALAGTPLFQPQLVAAALARHAARRRGLGDPATAWVTASAWVGAEWMVPKLLGDTLGIGLYGSAWLRQAADLGGVSGLTFVILLGNDGVRAAAVRRSLRPLAATGAIVAALAAYGALRLAALAAAPAAPTVAFGVVQAGVAHYDRLRAEIGTYEAVRRILDAQFEVSEAVLAGGPVDVLVWPETVYPTTFGMPKSEDGAAFDRAIAGLVVATGRPLVFGSYDVDGSAEYNAAFFLVPDGAGGVTYETYRKAALFPLTERVPAWLDGPAVRARLPWLGSWRPGASPAVVILRLADGRRLRVAPLICYDAVDPRRAAAAAREGAEVIVTLSNDSWLGAAAARVNFAASAFRSIETRRPQVRATPTGVSAVLTPTGEVLASADAGERAGIEAAVSPVAGAVPVAVRWGDWVGPTAMLAAAGLLLLGRRSRA